jgi:hypothetical protein
MSKPSLRYIVAQTDHSNIIRDITNSSFISDTFFKVPQYHERFTMEDVSHR